MSQGIAVAIERLQDAIGAELAVHAGRRTLADFARYRDDPLGFWRDVLHVPRIWERQGEMAERVRDNAQVAVAGANGAGKDWAAARIALWWVYARRGTVLLTGPTERQVLEVMMSELQRAFAPVPELPGRLYQAALRLDGEANAGVLAFTSTSSSRLTGFHAPALLVIVTEAQAVEPFVWESIFANAIGDESRILVVGNPLFDSGRFFECFRSASWSTLRLPATEHPNVITGTNVIPGAVTRDGVARVAREWGIESNAYKSRVLAEFPVDALESLIKRSWLDAAADRFENGTLEFGSTGPNWVAALDPARYGMDKTALACRQGPILRHLGTWTARDTMETCGLVLQQLTELGAPLYDKTSVTQFERRTMSLIIDEVGLGSGVLDRLKELGKPVDGFNGGRTPPSSRDAQRFLNQRASSYWHLRELLEANKIALPRHAQLFDELSATQWKVSSNGLIMLEAKDELSARLGRSPDAADAVSMVYKDFDRPGLHSWTADDFPTVKCI